MDPRDAAILEMTIYDELHKDKDGPKTRIQQVFDALVPLLRSPDPHSALDVLQNAVSELKNILDNWEDPNITIGRGIFKVATELDNCNICPNIKPRKAFAWLVKWHFNQHEEKT